MTFRKFTPALAFAALALVPSFAAAHAGPYLGTVTAYSDYGNGHVSAPVRRAQFGYQVKLPGGPWIYCERTSLFLARADPCSETLRRQTVDFWETQSEDQGGRGR